MDLATKVQKIELLTLRKASIDSTGSGDPEDLQIVKQPQYLSPSINKDFRSLQLAIYRTAVK